MTRDSRTIDKINASITVVNLCCSNNMKIFNFAGVVAISLSLIGCGEHELCEKAASLTAKAAINLVNGLKDGGTMGQLQSGANYIKELGEVKEEIELRKISCSKKF